MVLAEEKIIIWGRKVAPIAIIQNPFIFSANSQMNREEIKLENSGNDFNVR